MKAGPNNPIWEKTRQPVICRGVLYPSQSDCARAIGVTVATVQGHLERGTIDRCGLRDGKRHRTLRRKPVQREVGSSAGVVA